MTWKDKLGEWKENLRDKVEERRAYIIRKNNIFKYLSIADIEKLYKHYINKDLMKDIWERDKKGELVKKQVKMKGWEIKFKVKNKLDIDQIVAVIPSVKKYLEKDET